MQTDIHGRVARSGINGCRAEPRGNARGSGTPPRGSARVPATLLIPASINTEKQRPDTGFCIFVRDRIVACTGSFARNPARVFATPPQGNALNARGIRSRVVGLREGARVRKTGWYPARHDACRTAGKKKGCYFLNCGMSERISLPTCSIRCSSSALVSALKTGRFTMFSSIHSRANSPFRISSRISCIAA